METITKRICKWSLLAVFVSAAPIAGAHEDGAATAGYVGDSQGQVLRDSSGNCVRTPSFSADLGLVECGDAEAAPAAAPAPAPAPKPKMKTVFEKVTVGSSVLFDFDSATLKPSAKSELDALVAKLKSYPQLDAVIVTGHTDSTGPEAYNQGLSERRAAAVRDHLVKNGIDGSIIQSAGKGESQPVASNATRDGRSKNRRVEIEVLAKRAGN